MRLAKRTLAFSLAFLLATPFVPLYQYTEGYEVEGADLGIALESEGIDSALADVMTEDGFLLKPALNTESGDRSTANEIFAYQVKAGDTLSSIAQQFGIKKDTLAMENNLWNSDRLRTGAVIRVLPVDGIAHSVQKGETIDKIAKKYAVEPEKILRQNQLEKGQGLAAGQSLIIPGARKELKAPSLIVRRDPSHGAPDSAAGLRAPGGGKGRLIWPTDGGTIVTQEFRAGHFAMDIAKTPTVAIFAAASGRVVKAAYGWNGGYGNYIIIDHGDGMQTLYGHNEKLYVSEGDYVEQGKAIAWMGNTGRVYGRTGNHVHFEVRVYGVKKNPRSFLSS